ncbi:MAG: hypothetical protein LBO79_02605 [Zoogloeaceae bacterium]|jgi:hypothetical protein|nr:hypothetical protein [Zoogloeaceae bacterium]
MDNRFKLFFEKFGLPTHSEPADAATLARFQGNLPDSLLEFWRTHGFCGFREGLFWIVNPEAYEPDMRKWFGAFEGAKDYFVIARTAFGKLYLWSARTGALFTFADPGRGWLHQGKGSADDIAQGRADQCLETFLQAQEPDAQDIRDKNGQALFALVVEKLGPLSRDEVFHAPAPTLLPASEILPHFIKMDIHAYLGLMAESVELHVSNELPPGY